MKLTVENKDIPDWLKPHMKSYCDCGMPIVDDGPIDPYTGVMKLTQRWCAYARCPYHMAEKMNMLAKRFGIKGVGPAGCLETINTLKLSHHLDILRVWFRDKPKVDLYEVGEMAYIHGIDNKWKEWLAGYTSFGQYFSTEKNIPEVVLKNKAYLMMCEKYFDVNKIPLTRTVLKVMMTGSIHGFSSKQEFLSCVNEAYKGLLRVEDNKKTVRDTMFLIKEPESVDYSKTDIALRHNIPIVSSQEFLTVLKMWKEMPDED